MAHMHNPTSAHSYILCVVFLTACSAWGCMNDINYAGKTTKGSPPLIDENQNSTLLNDVGQDEWDTLCTAWRERIASEITTAAFCEGVTVLSARSVTQCEANTAQCVRTDPRSDAVCPNRIQGTCTATLEDWDLCIRTQVPQSMASLASISCQDAGTSRVSRVAESLSSTALIPECQPLLNACPGIFGLCDPEDDPSCVCFDNTTGTSCEFTSYDDPDCSCSSFAPTCGDNLCEPSEESLCPRDCGPQDTCGDGICTGEELRGSCDEDCRPEVDPYLFVLVEDNTANSSGNSPGMDLDAIVITRRDGSVLSATTIEDFEFGDRGPDDDALDPTAALGFPDSDCLVQNYVSLGGAEVGGYIIVGFADASNDGSFTRGDSVTVHEIGRTMCPNTTYNDDPYSVSVSNDLRTFQEIASFVQGNIPLTIP